MILRHPKQPSVVIMFPFPAPSSVDVCTKCKFASIHATQSFLVKLPFFFFQASISVNFELSLSDQFIPIQIFQANPLILLQMDNRLLNSI